jgi:hypothetical protein
LPAETDPAGSLLPPQRTLGEPSAWDVGVGANVTVCGPVLRFIVVVVTRSAWFCTISPSASMSTAPVSTPSI